MLYKKELKSHFFNFRHFLPTTIVVWTSEMGHFIKSVKRLTKFNKMSTFDFANDFLDCLTRQFFPVKRITMSADLIF